MLIDFDLHDPTNASFAELVKIQPVDGQPNVFQSKSIPFSPVKGASAVFGGHVLAQSVVAAGQTVKDGFICHSSSSYFLKPGNAAVPFIFKVDIVRDGGSYLTREVKAYQVEEEEAESFEFQNYHVCYIAILSFKRPQEVSLEYQVDANPEFDVPDAEIIKMEDAPDVDQAVIKDLLKEGGIEPQWHPIDCRKMDTTEYNKRHDLLDRRIVHWFRSPFQLPEDPHIHVALLLYISDRNSLFTLLNIQDDPWLKVKHIASLNHTFTLHMLDENIATDQGYIQMETWSDRAYDSRGLYNGRMYTRNGALLASFSQDGVVKVYAKI